MIQVNECSRDYLQSDVRSCSAISLRRESNPVETSANRPFVFPLRFSFLNYTPVIIAVDFPFESPHGRYPVMSRRNDTHNSARAPVLRRDPTRTRIAHAASAAPTSMHEASAARQRQAAAGGPEAPAAPGPAPAAPEAPAPAAPGPARPGVRPQADTP